jgi:hypothetical protein
LTVLNAREYISGVAANGRYDFTSREVQSAPGISADAAKLALNRLEKLTTTHPNRETHQSRDDRGFRRVTGS